MIAPSIWHGNGPFVLVPMEELLRFQQFVPSGISIFGLHQISPDTVFIVNQAAEMFATQAAPTSCLAMAAIDEDGYARLLHTSDLFSKWSGSQFIRPVRIDATKAAQAIPTLLLTQLLQRFRSISQQCTTFASDLSRLRASHEELHNNFAALEAFVVSSNIQPIKLAFYNPLTTGSFLEVPRTREVTQVLPTSTYGLSSVDIYVERLNRSNRRYGGIEIDLTTVEEGWMQARWNLEADQMTEGWINLGLPKTLGDYQRTARLTIRTFGGVGDMPPLGLGPPQPLKAFRAQLSPEDSNAPTASLAMRCWSGLPGIAPPNMSGSISSAQSLNRSAIKRVPIPFVILRAVEWMPTESKPEVKRVDFDEVNKAVRCNPPTDGITLARLPEISFSEIGRIEAQAFVQNSEPSSVEFAIVFSDLPTNTIAQTLLGQRATTGRFYFSGWISAVLGQPVPLSCVVQEPNITAHIFLATRIAPGHPFSSVEAAFHDLQITLLGLSNADQAQPRLLGEGTKIADTSRRHSRILPVDDLRRVRTTRGKNTPSTVQFDHAIGEIKCELSDRLQVIATIPHIRVKSAIHLSVKACAGRLNTASIEVGVAVAGPRATEEIAIGQLKKQSSAEGPVVFSGWHVMNPAEEAFFQLDIVDGTADFVSLYMMAQSELPSGNNVAVFSNISVLEQEPRNG
jgi:hypothetical protein